MRFQGVPLRNRGNRRKNGSVSAGLEERSAPQNSPVPAQVCPQPVGSRVEDAQGGSLCADPRIRFVEAVHRGLSGEPSSTPGPEERRRQQPEGSDRRPVTLEQKLLDLLNARQAGLTSQQLENSRRELYAIIEQELVPKREGLKAAVGRAGAACSGLPDDSKPADGVVKWESGSSGELARTDDEVAAPECSQLTCEGGMEDGWDEMKDLDLDSMPQSCRIGKPEVKSGSGLFDFLWGESKQDFLSE